MKRFLIGLGIVILLGIGLFTAWYFKTKAKNELFAKHYVDYGVELSTDENLRSSNAQRDKYINKAHEIRTLWEKDAVTHKKDLIKIFSTRSRENFSVLSKIIPVKPDYPLTDQNSRLPNGSFNQARVGYSWQMYRSPVDPDPADNQQSLGPFLEKGDTPLSISLAAGRKKIILWASGRITEKTIEVNPAFKSNPGSGVPVNIDVETEIEPPFDFLQHLP